MKTVKPFSDIFFVVVKYARNNEETKHIKSKIYLAKEKFSLKEMQK